MQELYRYEMTDRELQESARILGRCPGSRLFRQNLRILLFTGLFYFGVIAWTWCRIPPAARANTIMLVLYLTVVPPVVVILWSWMPDPRIMIQLQAIRAQKRAAGLDPMAPELHSIRLDGASYLHSTSLQASTAVPLASLRAAKPVKNGGVVLLFSVEGDDYLPSKLFSPAYTARDFCLWIEAQAAEARKAPPRPDATGQSAPADTIRYYLRFTLNAQQAARLLSRGTHKLFLTAGYQKQQLRFLRWPAVVVFVLTLLGRNGLLYAMLNTLTICGVFLLLCAAVTLLLSSRFAYRLRLRGEALDKLLSPQQVEFYEDHLVLCQAESRFDQGYNIYTQLLETPDAWFLVAQGAGSLLCLPKEGLPEYQHADFAAFVREKLAAARVQQGHGPAQKF